MATEENAALEENFILILQELSQGKVPKCSSEKFNAADANLNSVYRRVQKANDADLWGTVSKEGIKETQREWIRYRNAWVAFCQKKYPKVDSNSIKTWLTVERTEMLKQFVE
jgi:uncharacterized protein YecT (DUF1311 family)